MHGQHLRRRRKHARAATAGQEAPHRHITSVVRRNARALEKLRAARDAKRPRQIKMADAITAFTGSMAFVYIHVAWFAFWILGNVGIFGIAPFDPFPFGLLTMIVSLEAIFLSTFVLVSQNRMSDEAEQRAELDLHINVLSEHEVTHMLVLMQAIAEKLEIPLDDPELKELEQDVTISDLLHMIERQKERRERTGAYAGGGRTLMKSSSS